MVIKTWKTYSLWFHFIQLSIMGQKSKLYTFCHLIINLIKIRHFWINEKAKKEIHELWLLSGKEVIVSKKLNVEYSRKLIYRHFYREPMMWKIISFLCVSYFRWMFYIVIITYTLIFRFIHYCIFIYLIFLFVFVYFYICFQAYMTFDIFTMYVYVYVIFDNICIYNS